MSLFDEGTTITPPGSPQAGQGQDGGAASPEDEQYPGIDELDEQDENYGDEFEEEAEDEQEEPEEEASEEPGDQEQQPPADNSKKDDLILGKFKSQDDLAQAYLNLQREFSKRNQQPPSQQPATPQTTAPGQGQDQAQVFKQMFEQDPLGTMNYLIENAVAARTAPIMEQRQTDQLAANMQDLAKQYKQITNPEGMQQLFGKVAEIAQEIGNPQLARNPTTRILRLAASEAFGESGQQLYNKAKAEGRRQAEEARQQKRGLPTANTTAKKPKGSEAPKSESDRIRESIVAAGRTSGGILG